MHTWHRHSADAKPKARQSCNSVSVHADASVTCACVRCACAGSIDGAVSLFEVSGQRLLQRFEGAPVRLCACGHRHRTDRMATQPQCNAAQRSATLCPPTRPCHWPKVRPALQWHAPQHCRGAWLCCGCVMGCYGSTRGHAACADLPRRSGGAAASALRCAALAHSSAAAAAQPLPLQCATYRCSDWCAAKCDCGLIAAQGTRRACVR